VLQRLQSYNSIYKMAKRAASVVSWNVPKRRKTMAKPKIALSQLPASVKPEVKFSDASGTVTGFTNSVLVRPDIVSSQGNDGDQMIGSDVFLRSLDYSCVLPSTGWATARVSILIPRDPSISPTFLAPQNKYPHREFVVLHDELFSITERNHCRIKRKLDLKQKWNLTGSTITENNVIVVLNVDSSVSTIASVRTYFIDP